MPQETPKPEPKTFVQLRIKCPACGGILESEPLKPDGTNSRAPVRCTGCQRTWVNYHAVCQAKIAASKAQKVGPVDMARLGLEKTRVAIRAGRNVLEGSARIQEMLVGLFSEFKNFNGMESMQLIGEDLEDIAGQSLVSLDDIKSALAGRLGPDPERRRAKDVTGQRRPTRKQRRAAAEG